MIKEENSLEALEEIQNTLDTLKTELAEYSINSIVKSDKLPIRVDISADSNTSKHFPVIKKTGCKKKHI